MKDIFQQMQDGFMELGIVLSGMDLEQELGIDEIAEIYTSLVETYKSFEQGLCETGYICEECSKNKQELHRLIQMIKTCIKKGKLDEVSIVALVEFMYSIPQVLSELRTVYLENSQKHKA